MYSPRSDNQTGAVGINQSKTSLQCQTNILGSYFAHQCPGAHT
ncbi:MAG: hypothetical protein Q4E60_10390 [Bacteroidales bacterium]|nr:hypothetical protein [Bacteroidales bacterium]